jgi:hypothetical protein
LIQVLIETVSFCMCPCVGDAAGRDSEKGLEKLLFLRIDGTAGRETDAKESHGILALPDREDQFDAGSPCHRFFKHVSGNKLGHAAHKSQPDNPILSYCDEGPPDQEPTHDCAEQVPQEIVQIEGRVEQLSRFEKGFQL